MSFKKIRRKMMRPFEAAAFYVIYFFCRLLTYKGCLRLASILGSIMFMVPSQRKLVMANLSIAFPEMDESQKKKIGKKSIINLISVFIEFIWFYKRMPLMEKYVTPGPGYTEAFQKIQEEDKPYVLLAAHLGNWEVISLYHYKVCSRPLNSIARRIKNQFIENFMMDARQQSGSKIIHEKGAAKDLLKTMKRKEGAGLIVDQNTKLHQGGTFANFFGLPATTSRMSATLIKRYKPNVLFVSAIRNENGYTLECREMPRALEDYESEEEITQDILKVFEEEITKNPEQWVWLYNRWNYIPSDQPELKEKYPYYAQIVKS